MIKKTIYIILLLHIINVGFAQDTISRKKGYKYFNDVDLCIGTNGNQSLVALSWVKYHAPFKKQKFKIGYGLRYTGQVGKNLTYVTAPAELTSKQTGPAVLFSEIYYENVDTFFVSATQHNAINLSINLQYTFKSKLDVGFNIDAIGFTFGNKVNGQYISYQDASLNKSFQVASPTKINGLLISDNDIGSLNSELYARYWLNQKWAIKAGVSFLFTEYATANKLRLGNDRWRNKALFGIIGITFNPFN